MGRDKDFNDIFLIEKEINQKPCFEIRVLVSDIEHVKEKLSSLNAVSNTFRFSSTANPKKSKRVNMSHISTRLATNKGGFEVIALSSLAKFWESHDL